MAFFWLYEFSYVNWTSFQNVFGQQQSALKNLRKVKLSRGGAEGNQAFVKDMEAEDNYVQPRMKLLIFPILRSCLWFCSGLWVLLNLNTEQTTSTDRYRTFGFWTLLVDLAVMLYSVVSCIVMFAPGSVTCPDVIHEVLRVRTREFLDVSLSTVWCPLTEEYLSWKPHQP